MARRLRSKEKGVSTPSFTDQYMRLEDRFGELARRDGNVFLPTIRPRGPADFVFIAMEPSLRWASSSKHTEEEEAKTRITRGFKDFAFSLEDFILHFCIRNYLCREDQVYYVTNLSKGAMSVKQAKEERWGRYERWYPLLEEELEIVAKRKARIFAIGEQVKRFLQERRFSQLTATILHYAAQASKYRTAAVQGRESEFERFPQTVSLNAIEEVANDVMAEAGMDCSMVDDTRARIAKAQLTESRKQLMFGYKVKFEAWRQPGSKPG